MNTFNECTGRVTLPAQSGMEKEVLELAEKWGIDAVRDSDGTKLSPEISKMDFDVYSTLCIIREDNEWAKQNRDKLQQLYLMTEHETAKSELLEIDLLKNYFREQLEIDLFHDPKKWWEVIDRTTGEIVDASFWEVIPGTSVVRITKAIPWHSYTVTFLVYQIWEPVSMYNHITNSWTEEHKLPVDPRHPETREHILEVLDKWLAEHPDTDVVRFTTFFYNFDLVYDKNGKNKQFDWCGYLGSVSPLAIEEFEKVKGYRLKPEDLVDFGYYNTPFRVPSSKYLDWIDFQQKFISEFAGECVEHVHKAGKKAIMFFGDHWIGAEPYGKYFESIGLDGVVGSVGDGIWLRMTADIPIENREVRFLPYFFPDIFCENGEPVKEAQEVWRKARRALLRKSVERMGYGGYLSLAVKFPEFVDYIANVCNEFREIHNNIKGDKPYSAPFKVGILNAWGKLRSWQAYQVAHFFADMRMSVYSGVLEALSGMNVNVEFISFEDIKNYGIPEDMGVIINAGDAGTAWSGDKYWIDENIVTSIRKWVGNGGGLIGVGDPTAYEYQGRYFQLSDVLGVQKEIGFSLRTSKTEIPVTTTHFIVEDTGCKFDFSESSNYVFPIDSNVNLLNKIAGSTNLSANKYGNGRSVYICGLPFSPENTRLLLRAIYWAAGKEQEMLNWFSSNHNVECAAYLAAGKVAIINNSYEEQETVIYKSKAECFNVILKPLEIKWIDL